MMDGRMFDGIGKLIIGLAIAVVVLVGLVIGLIWWISSYDEIRTNQKIQPKEIIITIHPETGLSDTTYVY